MDNSALDIITVTLNPAIDQTLTVRDFEAGQVNRVENETSVAGGKGVNVASALADFGYRVGVTGFLGRENDTIFRDLFALKNINDRFLRLNGRTRIGIKVADPARNTTTDINFPGLRTTKEDLFSLEQEIAADDASWVVLAGSIPPGLDSGIYREITSILRARGHEIALDTSGEALRLALETEPEAMPHLIKPNIHELEALLGKALPSRTEVIEAARALVARGVETVAVSMGNEGACFVTRDEIVIAHPPTVEVISTVGAGDAMVAGIVAGRLRGLSLEECARLSTAFALDALTRLESGLSSPEVIEELAKKVNVSSR